MIDEDRFWRDGFYVLRGALPRSQVLAWPQHLLSRPKSEWDTSRGDFLSDPVLRGALLNDAIISIGRSILGDTLLYWGESNALIDGKEWGSTRTTPTV